jgi:hypothetical protein
MRFVFSEPGGEESLRRRGLLWEERFAQLAAFKVSGNGGAARERNPNKTQKRKQKRKRCVCFLFSAGGALPLPGPAGVCETRNAVFLF